MNFHYVWHIIRQAGAGWVDDKASRMAAALAFYTLLSLAPLFLIAVGIAGAIFGKEAADTALITEVQQLVGKAGADVAKTAIENGYPRRDGIWATIIGVAVLFYGASGVFVELQDALNTAWGVQSRPGRGLWMTLRDRVFSFGMVLVAGFLLLVSLIVTAALDAFGGYLNGLVPDLPLMMHFANLVIDFFVVTGLFALIFKYLPDAEIPWRFVWYGAIATALLFDIGKTLIGLYLGHSTITTPFGAAGSLVAFIAWVYYSGMILYFGVELMKATAENAGTDIRPTRNAELIRPNVAMAKA
jgi:membrane protein